MLSGSIGWRCSMRQLTEFNKRECKPHNLRWIFVLALTSLLSCGGGGSKSLSVTSDNGSTQMTLRNEVGLYQGITLSAKFSDGTTPSSVSWSSSVGCIGVRGPVSGPNGALYPNKADAVCGFTCPGGTYNGTITAAAEGLTGTIAVSCQITD